MPESETTITTSTDPGQELSRNEPIILAGGTSNTDPATVDHAGRLAQLEERFGQFGNRIDNVEAGQNQLNQNVQGLSESVKSSFATLSQQLSGLTQPVSNAIDAVNESVVEPAKDVVADAVPTIKEHAFFRKWGRS